MKLVVYSRPWCHLCEDMRAALLPIIGPLGIELEMRDVDEQPDWEALHGERIPVLTAVGSEGELELCHYRLDEAAVRSWLSVIGKPHSG